MDLTEIWNDHGTHAVNDFSCWNPLPPNDEFVVLSNVPQYNYNKPPRGFVFHSSDAKAFADPVDFTFVRKFILRYRKLTTACIRFGMTKGPKLTNPPPSGLLFVHQIIPLLAVSVTRID